MGGMAASACVVVIALVLAVFAEPGVCIVEPRAPLGDGALVIPQLIRRWEVNANNPKSTSLAFIGPFKPSDEDVQWFRQTFLGVNNSRDLSHSNVTSVDLGQDIKPPTRGLLGSLRFDRLSGALGAAIPRSLQLGRDASVWLRRRWRTKVLYCLLGVYGVRVAGRVVRKIRISILANSDIILDAEDKALSSRGAVYDVEGQALLIRLGFLPSPTSPSKSGAAPTTERTATDPALPETGEAAGGDAGWRAIELGVQHALRLRCAAGKRGKYANELAEALRNLEQAREEADMHKLGSEHRALAEDAVVLTQVRLCDAYLRSLRDGLILASADLSALSGFWSDQKSIDVRMGLIKSFVLGTLNPGQGSGKRLAVERDQEKMSASELLLQRYLRRLGGIQSHLQARPKASLETAKGMPGATLTPDAKYALEEWVDDGMYLFLQSLEEVEASEQEGHPGNDNGIDNGIAVAFESLRGGVSGYFSSNSVYFSSDLAEPCPTPLTTDNTTVDTCALPSRTLPAVGGGKAWMPVDGISVRGGKGGSFGTGRRDGCVSAVVLWPFPEQHDTLCGRSRSSVGSSDKSGAFRTAREADSSECVVRPETLLNMWARPKERARPPAARNMGAGTIRKGNDGEGVVHSKGLLKLRGRSSMEEAKGFAKAKTGGTRSDTRRMSTEKLGDPGEWASPRNLLRSLSSLQNKHKITTEDTKESKRAKRWAGVKGMDSDGGARAGGTNRAGASGITRENPEKALLAGVNSVKLGVLKMPKADTPQVDSRDNCGGMRDGARAGRQETQSNIIKDKKVAKSYSTSTTHDVDETSKCSAAEQGLCYALRWVPDFVRATRRKEGGSRNPAKGRTRNGALHSDKKLPAMTRGGGGRIANTVFAGFFAGGAKNQSIEATAEVSDGGNGAGAKQPSSLQSLFMSALPRWSLGVETAREAATDMETRRNLRKEEARSGWAVAHSSTTADAGRSQERTARRNRRNRIAAVKARRLAAAVAEKRTLVLAERHKDEAGTTSSPSLETADIDAGEGDPSTGASGVPTGGDIAVVDNEELGEWAVVPSDSGGGIDAGFVPAAGRFVRVFCRSLGKGVSAGWGGVMTAVCGVSMTALRVVGSAVRMPRLMHRKIRNAAIAGGAASNDDSAGNGTATAAVSAAAATTAPKYNWTSPFPLVKESAARHADSVQVDGTASLDTNSVDTGSGCGGETQDAAAAIAEETANDLAATAIIVDNTTVTEHPPSPGAAAIAGGTASDLAATAIIVDNTTVTEHPPSPGGLILQTPTTTAATAATEAKPIATAIMADKATVAELPSSPGVLILQTSTTATTAAAEAKLIATADDARTAWARTVPADGVPERSGRRSRLLVGAAARLASLAVKPPPALPMPRAAPAETASRVAGSISGGGGGSAGVVVLTRALQQRAAAEAMEVGAARPPPRKRLRRAVALAICLPLSRKSGRYVRDNWNDVLGLGLEATSGLLTFFGEQLWDPCKAVVNNVFFRQRSKIMDDAALDDAETSLRNMLRDFLEDTKYSTKQVREEAVAAADMSIVSRQLEENSRGTLRGTLNGRIPRMMLIQVAFLKKELLNAMQAIDELYQANQVTLKLISVVPAALFIYVASRLSLAVLHSVTSRRIEPTVLIYRSMRASIRDMERLLTSSRGFAGAQEDLSRRAHNQLAIGIEGQVAQRHSYQHMTNEALPESDGSKSKPSSERKTSELDSEDEAERASASGYSEGAVVEGVEVGSARAERVSRGGSVGKNSGLMDWSVRLSEEETGKLALCLHELQTTLRQNQARFESRTRRKLEEDLHDLTAGNPTVAQQIAVVGRMQRSYAFLRPSSM